MIRKLDSFDEYLDFIRITPERFDGLKELHSAYKAEIGENPPTEAQLARLFDAIEYGKIDFFGCLDGNKLIACCSICCTFSTFNYGLSGVFEDFYIAPEYRHKGIAKRLVRYAVEQSGVKSLTVGCADCDVEMYKAIGFSIPLGNMLAYGLTFN
ncbi:MAG: GNAT family N-acetyltransferase [Clostridia bacterium]|nr:GNAT family N-acetyltransferase [Clostridia bacterium]